MAVRVKLRNDAQLAKFMALKGFKNMHVLAEAMGVNHSTVSRIFSGEAEVGMVFLTGLLTVFPELDFDDLFKIVGQGRGDPQRCAISDDLRRRTISDVSVPTQRTGDEVSA